MSKTLEELGHEIEEDELGNILFVSDKKTIVFFKKRKTFGCVNGWSTEYEEITMEELKAIYKYCEDNKWI